MNIEIRILGVGFLLTFILIYLFKDKFLRLNLSGVDINKENRPKIPESMGLFVIAGVLTSLFLVNDFDLVAIITIVCFAVFGFADDILHINAKKRTLIALIVSIPYVSYYYPSNILLMVFAVIYILGAASFVNTFAGLNGWEVGSSFILLSGLVYLTWDPLALAFWGAVLALLVFNVCPAKVLPGDSTTLAIGSGIGIILLQNHLEILGFCIFIPHFIDIALKLTTNLKDISQKKVEPYHLKNNKLHIPGGKLDFAKLMVHLFGPMEEWRIVAMIWIIVALNTGFWCLISQI